MTGRQVAVGLAGMVALGVLLSLLGPFGTFAMPWPARVLDWLLFMVGGYALFRRWSEPGGCWRGTTRSH